MCCISFVQRAKRENSLRTKTEGLLQGFKSGVERLVGIKLKEGTCQEAIDTMVKSLHDLNDAPELSPLLVQITAGKYPVSLLHLLG